MREIHISEIISTVRDLCIESNYYLSNDVKEALCKAKENETWPYVKIQVWHVYLLKLDKKCI